MIDPGTRFAELYARGGLRDLPDDETAAQMYETTQEVAAAAGMPAYEVSNHARPGMECRHNLVYWRYGDYVGVGPGAHGRRTIGGVKRASEAIRSPLDWLRACEADGAGLCLDEPVSRSDQAEDYLMMALRLSEGVDLARYERLSGRALPPRRLADLTEDGLLAPATGRLIATPRGRMVLNSLTGALLG